MKTVQNFQILSSGDSFTRFDCDEITIEIALFKGNSIGGVAFFIHIKREDYIKSKEIQIYPNKTREIKLISNTGNKYYIKFKCVPEYDSFPWLHVTVYNTNKLEVNVK